MKNKFIFLSVIIILCSAGVFAQNQSAPQFVEAFYKLHRSRPDIFKAGEVNLYKKWFSVELNKLFQNELTREKAYLKQNPTDKPHFGDGFPFEPLDECYKDGKSYNNTQQAGAVTTDGDKTIVEIKFSNPQVCGGDLVDTYKVELIKNSGGWLINDWLYSDGSRLTDDLKRKDY